MKNKKTRKNRNKKGFNLKGQVSSELLQMVGEGIVNGIAMAGGKRTRRNKNRKSRKQTRRH